MLDSDLGDRHDLTQVRNALTLDIAPVVGFLPHGQARAGRAPSFEHLGVWTRARSQPLKEIKNQILNNVVGHGAKAILPKTLGWVSSTVTRIRMLPSSGLRSGSKGGTRAHAASSLVDTAKSPFSSMRRPGCLGHLRLPGREGRWCDPHTEVRVTALDFGDSRDRPPGRPESSNVRLTPEAPRTASRGLIPPRSVVPRFGDDPAGRHVLWIAFRATA